MILYDGVLRPFSLDYDVGRLLLVVTLEGERKHEGV